MDIFIYIFVDMKEVHIKIPESEFQFMKDFKEKYKVGMQEFIIKAVKDNIELIKEQHQEQLTK